MTFRSLPHLTAFIAACIAIIPGTCTAQVLPGIGGGSIICQHTGSHLPNKGTIRGLVVCVQSRNDQMYDMDWTLGAMPSWADEFAQRVKAYMSAMSQGTLTINLDIYPKLCMPPVMEEEYIWKGFDYGQAAVDILTSIDSTMDYADYDNWKSDYEPYHVSAGPDKRVDLVIMLYRSITNASFFPFSAVSDLGFWGDIYVDDSLRHLYGGTRQFNDAGSSGITMGRRVGTGMATNLNWSFRVAIHEIMHKIWGDAHSADLYGGIGLMGQYGSSTGMSAYERETLGYMTSDVVPYGVDTTIVMRDCITTGHALLWTAPGMPDGSLYSFEFRGKLSDYDTAPTRGVYISTLSDTKIYSQKKAVLQSADGKWIWGLDPVSHNPVKLAPDGLRGQCAFQILWLNNNYYVADAGWGDSTAAFRPAQPWFRWCGNPSPDVIIGKDTVHTRLIFKVLGMTDSTATVTFRYDHDAILSADGAPLAGPAEIAAYPNPVSRGAGVVAVRIGASLRRSAADLDIVDALGRVVRTQSIDPNAALTQVGVSALAPGFYLLRVRGAANQASHRICVY